MLKLFRVIYRVAGVDFDRNYQPILFEQNRGLGLLD